MNCHWQIICYLFTAESVYTLVYTRDQLRSAGSGVADRDPRNIWSPWENLQIFRRRYIVGTLTNKANISI